jgi:hypothetical protein
MVSNAHHGEVRGCRRACERTPLRGRRRCAAGGRLTNPLQAPRARRARAVDVYHDCHGPHAARSRIGATALNLVSSSLAPTTYANYDSGMHHFAAFCREEGIHPLQATTQSIVRYTA